MAKKVFVVGDIHGNLDEFITLEKRIQKECERTGDEYEIICTGDIMNGGPKSYELFKYIHNKPNFKLILGNNDEFFCSGQILGNTFVNMGVADAISCNDASGVTETFKNIFDYYKGDNVPSYTQVDDINIVNAMLAYETYFKERFKESDSSALTQKIKKLNDSFTNVQVGEEFVKVILDVGNSSLMQRISANTDKDGNPYKFIQAPKFENLTEQTSKRINALYAKMKTGVYGRSRMNDDPAFEKYIIQGKPTSDSISKEPYTEQDRMCIIFLAQIFKEMQSYFEKCPVSKIIEEDGKKVGLSHAGFFSYDAEGNIIKEMSYLQTIEPEDTVEEYLCEYYAKYKEPNIYHTSGVNERWGRGNGKNTELSVRDESNTLEGLDFTIHGHVPRSEKFGNVVCSFGKHGRLVAVNLDGGAKGMEKDGNSVIRCFEPSTGIILTINTNKEIVKSTVGDYRRVFAERQFFGDSTSNNVRENIKNTISNNQDSYQGQ